jgi:MFS transporter, SET family, sugar efflux transporter
LSVLCRNTEALLSTDADRSSFFIALVIADVLAGVADAISGPYVVLFLVDQARLGPLALSAILSVRALSGIAFGTAFGAWIDRRTTLAPLLLALAGSAVGYTLLGFTTNFALLLVIAALPIAIGAAAFSQSIALVKRQFGQASLHTANRAIGVMRASWSLAWAIGPAVGALIVGMIGFRGAFLASAASAVIALMTLLLVRARPLPADATHANRRKPANGGPAIALAFASLALFHTAMFLGSIPLPIVLITSLGGAKSDIGVAMSLCAALEIIVMGALIWRPFQRGERAAIVVGFAAFVAYFVALALMRSVAAVFWAQILRAIGIGLVSYTPLTPRSENWREGRRGNYQ